MPFVWPPNRVKHFHRSGFGLKGGRGACTGAWDSASIIVVGTDEGLMAVAVNRTAIPYLKTCEQGLVNLQQGTITPLIIGEMDEPG